MRGWKVKTGSILLAVGAGLVGSAGVCPNQEIGNWVTFAGVLIGGIGGGLTSWGIGHKVEKNNIK
jgi:hypothetical protein